MVLFNANEAYASVFRRHLSVWSGIRVADIWLPCQFGKCILRRQFWVVDKSVWVKLSTGAKCFNMWLSKLMDPGLETKRLVSKLAMLIQGSTHTCLANAQRHEEMIWKDYIKTALSHRIHLKHCIIEHKTLHIMSTTSLYFKRCPG